MATQFDEHQKALYEKRWTWDDIPFYHGPGGRQTVSEFHDLDYLEVYERVFGRKIGCNGIGRLREVALAKITAGVPDIPLCQEEQARYAEVLESQGVTVNWIDWGEAPAGPLGPIQALWAVQELLVINGGAVVPKLGSDPFSFGRAEWLSKWAFWNLNIPTLLTIHGTAVCEAGATVWLAEDVYVAGDSVAYNQEGREQLLSVIRLTSGVDDLRVLTIRCQGSKYFDRETGATAHVTNLIAPLTLDTVLAYPPGIDAGTLIWLERNGYTVIEVDREDHRAHNVCNLTLLEPGRVIMAAEATRTIEKVRRAGVQVIEVPYSGFQAAAGGLHRATMQIYREQGPTRFQ